MNLELTVLGSSSAIPLVNRFTSSQYLSFCGRNFLIDCGEGTQLRLRENKLGFGRLNHIFISHLHGDHIFGLAPLLSTLHLLDRKKEMHIYSHKGLKESLQLQIKMQGSWFKYSIIFHELSENEEEIIYEDEKLYVKSFPLAHGIPCCGFLFQEKDRQRHINREALKTYGVPIAEINRIKNGEDWININGEIIPNEKLTTPADPSLSYAYCTDTKPLPNLNEFVQKPTILYHEATFKNEHESRAKETNHSTAQQAAEVALNVEAENLLLGHFSIRYNQFDVLLDEAKAVFANSFIAEQGKKYTLGYKGGTLKVSD